jgi:hypothetical protein
VFFWQACVTPCESDAIRLEREGDLVFQIVVPTHGLLLGSIGIHDDFLMDALLADGIAL